MARSEWVNLPNGHSDGRCRRTKFAVAPGQLALAPGSSGWTDPRGRETCWMELFLRGGNAWERFGRPPIGAVIELGGESRST